MGQSNMTGNNRTGKCLTHTTKLGQTQKTQLTELAQTQKWHMD